MVDDEDPPEPDQRYAPTVKLVAALAVEGAIFRVAKGLTDYGARRGFAAPHRPLARRGPGPRRGLAGPKENAPRREERFQVHYGESPYPVTYPAVATANVYSAAPRGREGEAWRTRQPEPISREGFAAFAARSAEQAPVVMLNLLRFKPDGGRERYAEYGAAVAPMVERLGGRSSSPATPASPCSARAPGTWSCWSNTRAAAPSSR